MDASFLRFRVLPTAPPLPLKISPCMFMKSPHRERQKITGFPSRIVRLQAQTRRAQTRPYMVWLNSSNTSRPSKKLDWKRLGPFQVVKLVGLQVYKVALPLTMRNTHDTPFLSRSHQPNLHRSAWFPTSPTAVIHSKQPRIFRN